MDELTRASKVVFSSTLQAPLSWPNSELVSGDAVEAVRAMKRDGSAPLRTIVEYVPRLLDGPPAASADT